MTPWVWSELYVVRLCSTGILYQTHSKVFFLPHLLALAATLCVALWLVLPLSIHIARMVALVFLKLVSFTESYDLRIDPDRNTLVRFYFLRLNNIALYAQSAILRIFIATHRHRPACFHVSGLAVKAVVNTDVWICLWDRLGGHIPDRRASLFLIFIETTPFFSLMAVALYVQLLYLCQCLWFLCVYTCIIHKLKPQTQYISIKKQGLYEVTVIKI